jgi:hypothetical protein
MTKAFLFAVGEGAALTSSEASMMRAVQKSLSEDGAED